MRYPAIDRPAAGIRRPSIRRRAPRIVLRERRSCRTVVRCHIQPRWCNHMPRGSSRTPALGRHTDRTVATPHTSVVPVRSTQLSPGRVADAVGVRQALDALPLVRGSCWHREARAGPCTPCSTRTLGKLFAMARTCRTSGVRLQVLVALAFVAQPAQAFPRVGRRRAGDAEAVGAETSR